MADPSREEELELALTTERLARQQAERELESFKLDWASEVTLRQGAEAQLTLSEQARAQAEQAREQWKVNNAENRLIAEENSRRADRAEQARARLRTALEDLSGLWRATAASYRAGRAVIDMDMESLVLESCADELVAVNAGATPVETGATESAQSALSSVLTVPQETTTDETP